MCFDVYLDVILCVGKQGPQPKIKNCGPKPSIHILHSNLYLYGLSEKKVFKGSIKVHFFQ